MSSLEKYGIIADGAKALQHLEVSTIASDDFFERAEQLLENIEGVVRDEVISNLDEYYGRWHPSGFMVYPLGTHAALGGLRLHVWPQGFRQREVKGLGQLDDQGIYDGDIHNHGWHITSRILGGQYKDNIYEVTSPNILPGSLSDEEVARQGLWRVFQVRYRTAETEEALQATGSYVAADLAVQRQYDRGTTHIIKAGPFHAPTIPEDQLSATLLFNSHRVSEHGPDILVAGSSRTITGNRRDVSIEEAREVRTQLS